MKAIKPDIQFAGLQKTAIAVLKSSGTAIAVSLTVCGLQQFVAAGDKVGEGFAFQQAVGEQCEVGDLACLFVAG